jgi:hypothetical protein
MSGFDSTTEANVTRTLQDSSLYSLATKHALAIKGSAEKNESIVKRDYSALADVHEIPGEYCLMLCCAMRV